MNPPIYRITGADESGSRKLLWTNKGWSIYTDHESAKRALAQFNGNNGRWHRRYLTDLRIDRADPSWTPVES